MTSQKLDSITPALAYRLSGEVEGELRTFQLTSNTTCIGSHKENDLVLRVAGVSRRHVVLNQVDGKLWVEDRGSKNGTWINGYRVTRAPMEVGDELSVGSVALRLEDAHPQDACLALSFSTEDRETLPWTRSGRDLRETDLLHDESAVMSPLLRCLEALVEALTSTHASRWVDALDVLLEHLGCSGAAVLSWRQEQEPTLLALTGDLDVIRGALDHHALDLRRARDRSLSLGAWQHEVLGGGPVAGRPVAGIQPLSRDEAGALVLTGDFPERATCGPLLRFVGLLLVHLGPLSIAEPIEERQRSAVRLSFPEGHVAGRSSAIELLYREMETVCSGSYPILILGETGSGKEMISRTLHRSSPRNEKPFVAVNCAAIPADMIEAEMFGVARGAATGVSHRPGCFSRADGGTLFLDEVGELHPDLQAKLLRALEYGEVQPVGGKVLKVDVRVISATNVDLEQRIKDGGFRADLYYRLAASVIQIPPLRQRRDDLPILIQHFVERFAAELDLQVRGVTQRAFDLLLDYPWPGNVRELQHELRRAVQKMTPQQALDSSLLSDKILHTGQPPITSDLAMGDEPVEPTPTHPPEDPSTGDTGEPATLVLKDRVAVVERQVISEALSKAGGNKTLAAQLLQISRNTLATKMAQYDLS